tara:strand:+ start:279 stop:398 length:120 start_codon:yes stop_codon:yes gene_type:complete
MVHTGMAYAESGMGRWTAYGWMYCSVLFSNSIGLAIKTR